MNSLGLISAQILDFLIFSVWILLLANVQFLGWLRSDTRNSIVNRMVTVKSGYGVLALSLIIFFGWITALRQIPIQSLPGKVISLLQNYYPYETWFWDGIGQSKQFYCSTQVDIYLDGSCIGPLYNYPAIYKYFPSSLSNFSWVSVTSVFICWILISAYLIHRSQITLLGFTLLSFSPALFFTYERANWETLVAFFLLLGSWAIWKSSVYAEDSSGKYYFALSILCLTLLVMLKFFGILFAIAMFFLVDSRLKRYIVIFCAVTLSLWTYFELELIKGLKNGPTPGTSSLGLRSLLKYWEFNFGFVLAFLTIFLLRKKILGLIRRSLVLGQILYTNRLQVPLLGSLFVYNATWLLTSNVFYRALLISPLILMIVRYETKLFIMGIFLSINYLTPFTTVANFASFLLLVVNVGVLIAWLKNVSPKFSKRIPYIH